MALKGDGWHAWQTLTSQATLMNTKASSGVKSHWSTSSFAASSHAAFIASGKSPDEVPCATQLSASSVTGQRACRPLTRSNRTLTSPAISTPVPQISPSPIAACMSPTANIPPGWRTGKWTFAPGPWRWSSRLPPCSPANAFVSSSPPGRDADDADHRPRAKSDPVRHHDLVAIDSEDVGLRRLDLVDQLAEAGDDRRPPLLDRVDGQELDDEGIAGLRTSNRDRAGCAVHPGHVDRGDEVRFARDLAGEAVVRLERDDLARLHLGHRLEVRAEAPDDLVARDPMLGCGCHHAGSGAPAVCGPCGSLLRDRLELVADAVARLNEGVLRRRPVDLVAQAAHEDVDGSISMSLAAAPDLLEQLVSGRHQPAVESQCVEKPELRRRQLGAAAVDVGLHLARIDPQLLDLDRVSPLLRLRPHLAPGRRLDAGDELLHRERLDEVIVRADLERVHAVVLGPACADDDDRSPDALGARRLDQAPAVEARQHQVEDDDVRRLIPKAGQTDLAAPDGDRVESRPREVLGHARRDHLVVLDDQHLRHRTYLIERESGPIQRATRRVHRRRFPRVADAARPLAGADRWREPPGRRPGGRASAGACRSRVDGRADRRRALPQRARDRARGRLARLDRGRTAAPRDRQRAE